MVRFICKRSIEWAASQESDLHCYGALQEAELLGLCGSAPKLQKSDPLGLCTWPVLQEANPLELCARPALQEANPLELWTRPALQEANPLELWTRPALQESDPLRLCVRASAKAAKMQQLFLGGDRPCANPAKVQHFARRKAE
ncbi:hypothetical protein DQX05_05580 [Paenibacillus thiaminolyticus]|uniref:Uncharacterized protein n=1 Tax=Paenibacillus thiaminolyticus TaxID=49283 RepID=A0A3A3GLL6_PANTH|nr:hypothetical protein DQX05_05580 [Paenibacillus thiaminolyticus]